jgi:hypothetical protein
VIPHDQEDQEQKYQSLLARAQEKADTFLKSSCLHAEKRGDLFQDFPSGE